MTVVEEKKKGNRNLWIGLGAAALFCLCALGVLAIVLVRMGQQVQQGMKRDPQAAAETAHAIADYELPEGYQEEFAINVLTTSMVFISPEESGSYRLKPTIMLSQIGTMGSEEQIREQMRQSYAQQKGLGNVKMELVNVKMMNIRGQESEVATYEGSTKDGAVFRQIISTFPGKDGLAMLMITGPAEYWDEEAIDAFIESIH